jgi:type II secretory pathway component PulK
MILHLLAIWSIVIATLVWFVHDEMRRRSQARLATAARYYAFAGEYRHVSPGEKA